MKKKPNSLQERGLNSMERISSCLRTETSSTSPHKVSALHTGTPFDWNIVVNQYDVQKKIG